MTFRFLCSHGAVSSLRPERDAELLMAIGTISKTNDRVVGMELRKRVRHRLAANAVFTWQGAQQSSLFGAGLTRDISFDGAFIFSLTCPPVGSAIQLDVLLLPLQSGERSLRMKTEATVIRVEHANGIEGFAVVIEGVSLAEGSSHLSVERI